MKRFEPFDPSQAMKADKYELHFFEDVHPPKVRRHAHRHYEVLFVASGSVVYQVENQEYSLRRGDLLFISPGIEHVLKGFGPEKGAYTRIVLWLSQSFLDRLRQDDPSVGSCFERCASDRNWLVRSPEATWQALFSALQMIRTEEEGDLPGRRLMTWLIAAQILVHFDRTVHFLRGQAPPAANVSLIKTISDYIHENYGSDLSLDFLANRFSISPSTLSHTFKKETGLSVYHYIQQRRLVAAKNLILSGAAAGKIYTRCGFSDYSTFYRAFCREYGKSPSEMKKSGVM